MDRDEGNQPTDPGDSGSDWSIEDFDDFSPFDGLDLEGGEAAQSQLEFEPSDPDAEPTRAPQDSVVPQPETPRVESASDTHGHGDTNSTEADQPDLEYVPDDDSESFESLQPVAGEVESAPFVAEASGADDLAPDSAFGFDAPVEPEASMGRHRPVPSPSESETAVPAVFDHDEVPDFAAFTQQDYVQATTQEYAGLAEEVARAATQESEQMAVSAGIPGLESGVVGLEDVLDESDAANVAEPVRGGGSDLSIRVLTAVALISIFFGSLYQDYLVAILIFAVMFIAAVEMYVVLMRVGHRPMTLFGLIGIGSALFGTWYWGTIAIPVALILTTIATLVFFGVVAHRKAPLLDTALTLLVVGWIGGLGSLAMDIAFAPDFAWMIAAVVVITALMDVAQYFVGRRFGKRQLAPTISPKKTVEGLAGGVIVALGVGAVIGNFGPFELADGLLLGAIAALVGPLGDLAVSVVKRAIGVKDMGAILPGHGGVLDRIDAMIFVIPAAWIAYSWMGLIAP